MAYPAGVTIGLAFTALMLGLRHGFDWDHIAAIADLSGTAENRKRGFLLSLFYALGHGAVVLVLGIGAIIFGLAIPSSLDDIMGKVVGVTLIALGVWVLFDLARNGRDFRLRSRWMLILGGAFAGLRRVQRGRQISIEHDHAHPHEHAHADEAAGADASAGHDAAQAHDHPHVSDGVVDLAEPIGAVTAPASPKGSTPDGRSARSGFGSSSFRNRGHTHTHRHELALPSTATASYGGGAATGIGMLHGVGIESPTQIAVFVASSSVVGWGFGVTLLVLWVVGLIVANGILAILAGTGLLQAERNFGIYAGLAIVVSIASIILGCFYLLA